MCLKYFDFIKKHLSMGSEVFYQRSFVCSFGRLVQAYQQLMDFLFDLKVSEFKQFLVEVAIFVSLIRYRLSRL